MTASAPDCLSLAAFLHQVVDDQPGLIHIGGQIADVPLPGGGPQAGEGGREDVGDLLLFEIVLDRLRRRRPKVAHHGEHLVALDESLRVGHRLGRLIHMVVGDQPDLAAVDAAGVVHPIEHGLHAGLDVDPPVGHRTGQVQAGAEDHLLVGDAVLRPGRCAPGQDEKTDEGGQNAEAAERTLHGAPPFMRVTDGRDTIGGCGRPAGAADCPLQVRPFRSPAHSRNRRWTVPCWRSARRGGRWCRCRESRG